MTSPVLVDRGVGGARWRRRALRRLAPLAAAGLAAGAFAAAAAAPAGAAAACPNDAYRTGPSAHLADCRAYELVSPADKGANTLLINHGNGNSPVYAAADGDAVAFAALTPLPGSVSGQVNNYVADRTADGWRSHTVMPYDCAADASGLFTTAKRVFVGLSRDFSQAVLQDGESCTDPRDQAGVDVYVRSADGQLTWASQNGQVKTDDLDAAYASASDDLRHLLFSTPEQLFPAIDAGRLPGSTYAPIRGLYDRVDGATHEVGVDGDGKLLNICGTNLAGQDQATRPVSDDGRVVFFTPTYNATEPDCDYAHGGDQLYARVDNALTVAISRSQIDPTAAPTGKAYFLGATPDGRHVFFASADQLVADSAAVGGGLYEYDLSRVLSGASQTGTLTFISSAPSPYAFQPALAISPDGETAYFIANGVLPAGGQPSAWSLYRLEHGSLRYVVTSAWSLQSAGAVSVSPDLSKVVYMDIPTGGVGQIYLYDADRPSAAPTCVSCPSAGVTASAAASLRSAVGAVRPLRLGRTSFVTDDGRVFFSSLDRISDRDVNDVWDVYEYADGNRTLLSAGTGANDSLLIGVAGPDGRDVLFSTNDSLVAADVDNGDQDIYDARVDGGFPEPAVPAACRGAGCRGPVPAPPTLTAAGTLAFTGSGNVTATSPAAKHSTARARVARRIAVRGNVFRLKVRVPAAGTISVRGRSVRRARRSAAKAATYRVRVALTKRARHALARRHVLRMRVHVVFRPRHGRATSAVVAVTVRRPTARRARAGRAAADRRHRSVHRRHATAAGRSIEKGGR